MSAKHKTWVSQSLLVPDTEGLENTGIGPVAVIRPRGGDRMDVGFFLVDRFCLGVKDAWFESMDSDELEKVAQRMFPEGHVEKSGAWGRKFVESAVAYAKSLGLSPAADYNKGARVFGGVRAEDCDETFVFGYNGKPLFFQGPHDTPKRVDQVLTLLRQKCGEGGFHYVLVNENPFGQDEDWDDDEEDWDEDAMEDYGDYEDLPIYRAEQTGGGTPCKDLQKALKSFQKVPPLEEMTGDLEYMETFDEVAEDVRELVMMLEKAFSDENRPDGKSARQLREFSVFAADILLKAASVPPEMREKLLSETGLDPEAGQKVIKLLEMEALNNFLDSILQPFEDIRRVFLEVGHDSKQPLNQKPRVWAIFFEIPIDPQDLT